MMRALSAAEILGVWEEGSDSHPAEQALSVLAAACPEQPAGALAALPLGARDALLLAARERLFGGTLAGLVRCPACAGSLEFALASADLRANPADDDALAASPKMFRATLYAAEPEGTAAHVVYRLPSSGDLLALRGVADPATFRRELAERCVIDCARNGTAMSGAELPDDLLTALAAEMSTRDPQAEVLLGLACPACGAEWQAVFDIAAYFWAELAAEAKRLLREVDALARTYGWRETDILALSPRRRQTYLEMVLR